MPEDERRGGERDGERGRDNHEDAEDDGAARDLSHDRADVEPGVPLTEEEMLVVDPGPPGRF